MKKDASLSGPTPRQNRSNVLPLKGEIDLHVSPSVTALLNAMIDKKPEREIEQEELATLSATIAAGNEDAENESSDREGSDQEGRFAAPHLIP